MVDTKSTFTYTTSNPSIAQSVLRDAKETARIAGSEVSFPGFYAAIFSCGFLSCHARQTGIQVTRSTEPVDSGYDLVSLLRRNNVVKHGVAF